MPHGQLLRIWGLNPLPWSRQADPTSQIEPVGIALTAHTNVLVAPVPKRCLLGQNSHRSRRVSAD
jgi:hypothetical protein